MMCHQQGGIVKLSTALYHQRWVICDVIRVLPGMVAGISQLLSTVPSYVSCLSSAKSCVHERLFHSNQTSLQ